MAEIKIDIKRRDRLRKLHTATHILNYSAKKILGNHVWQNGSNLKPDIGTLDITHYKMLSRDEIESIESEVNRIIDENLELEIVEMDRTEAERKFGYTIYQGGAVPLRKLRVVKISDIDIEACGGLHMLSTGGIGVFRIVDVQRIQDGVIRLSYLVSDLALRYSQEDSRILDDISQVLKTGRDELGRSALRFFNEWKEQKKEIEDLKEEIQGNYIEFAREKDEVNLVLKYDFDMKFMSDLYSRFENKKRIRIESLKFIISNLNEEGSFKKVINKGDHYIHIK